jgi:hypothetical protein
MHFPGQPQNLVKREITAIPDWLRIPRLRNILSTRAEGVIRASADHLVISFYEGNIWDRFDGLVHWIYLVTELLKIFFISYFLVFYDSEDDFINYVGIVFGHRSEYKRQSTKDKIEDFYVEKTSAEYTEVRVFVFNMNCKPIVNRETN